MTIKDGKNNPNYKHGLKGTKEYGIWVNIKTRCYNEKSTAYKNYGGRGIILYDKWLDDPLSFVNYIKGLENYGVDGYSLDRINNDGNYEPDNLRWSDKHIQQVNRRKQINNLSGYVGVSWDKYNKKYMSYIKINKKQIYLGCFNTKEESLNARNQYIIDNELDEYDIQST